MLFSSDEELEYLQTNTECYSQLIPFHVSHIFNLWYDEEPNVKSLSDDLHKHLKTRYYDYYRRIKKINKTR